MHFMWPFHPNILICNLELGTCVTALQLFSSISDSSIPGARELVINVYLRFVFKV